MILHNKTRKRCYLKVIIKVKEQTWGTQNSKMAPKTPASWYTPPV